MPIKMKKLFGLAPLLLMLAAPAGQGVAFPGAGLDPLLSDMQVGAVTRKYFLYAPKAEGPLPMVIVLHGGGGAISAARDLGFEALANKDKFLVVYPKGIRRHWMDGRDTDYARNPKNQVDDIAFLKALVDKLVAEKKVDPSRIYITGMSNGAIMAYRAGCELSDRLAAIAPVAGNLPKGYRCRPSHALPVLAINGTADPLVPWQGGAVGLQHEKRPPRKVEKNQIERGEVLSVEETLALWRSVNRCADAHHQKRLPKKSEGEYEIVTFHQWEGCNVQLYQITAGGHSWPGIRSSLLVGGNPVMGQESMQLDATTTIWDFFKDKKRQK